MTFGTPTTMADSLEDKYLDYIIKLKNTIEALEDKLAAKEAENCRLKQKLSIHDTSFHKWQAI